MALMQYTFRMSVARRGIARAALFAAALIMTTPITAAPAVPPTKPLSAQVTVSREAYEGWQNVYILSNGTAEVVIVPQIARIMRYGLIGGANLLWNNPAELGKPGDLSGNWRNFGGDKPWPWSQDDWAKWFGAGWPPPLEADQLPQTAELIGASTIRLTSQTIPKIGCRLVREITLAETGSRLYIVTKLERVADGFTDPVGAWTITQTPYVSGDLTAGLLPGSTTLAEGWRMMSDTTPFAATKRSADGTRLFVTRDPKATSGRKFGFDGDTLSGVFGSTRLTIRADSPGAKGFDWRPGERGQIYISEAASPYIEWEFTSPMIALKKGEAAILNTTFEAVTEPSPQTNGIKKP